MKYTYTPEYLDFLQNNNLFAFEMLDENAKEIALMNFLSSSKFYLLDVVGQFKQSAKKNIHTNVNNANRIRTLIASFNNHLKMKNDINFCKRSLYENLIEFDIAGNYVPYIVEPKNFSL